MKHLLITTLLFALSAGTPASRAEEVARPAQISKQGSATFPYSMAGQIIFSSGKADYQGSAAVVHKRSVLTAAHNLWDPVAGWSTNIEFNRARNGATAENPAYGSRIFVLGGYQSNARRYGSDSLRAFAFDLGGVRFSTALASGNYAGWRADSRLLTNGSYNVAIGYGADNHSGDDMLFVSPPLSYEQIYGPFFENDTLTFEGGMSGGPVFADIGTGELRIVGIVVAGSDDPPTGGIRALNPAAGRFLNTYLRY
jgi:V8-like Glu-specific endopeptidase